MLNEEDDQLTTLKGVGVVGKLNSTPHQILAKNAS
jgi:hypothetical protein